MWFEILPSMGIILVGVTFPPLFSYYMHKIFQNGNAYRRDVITDPFNLGLYRRDVFLIGNPYKSKGLDSVPDE